MNQTYIIQQRFVSDRLCLRWCIVRTSDNEIICHREKRIDLVQMLDRFERDDIEPVSEPDVEHVYQGRVGAKLSLPSALRKMIGTSIPTPEPDVIKNRLYPPSDDYKARVS